ncbi:hypothetical protein NKR19_g815 [Coniochaeta hoffmannii]|uniref:Uncharacterized protein n=1 Tax=Coniochaeta hoffmannii TaxID=91930 RepID=A0AA38W0L0_9PEZI|nr:hypothetical protein NKR19_g815 [Coniochaeta hoffmannii]
MPPSGPRAERERPEQASAEPPHVPASKRSPAGNAKLEDVLRNCVEIAQKKMQTEQQLDLKRLKQRKTEYTKSLFKHTDFGSIPEFQKHYRDRQEKDLADLEKTHKAQVAEFDKTIMELAASVVQALPLEIDTLVHRCVQEQVPKRSSIDESMIKALEGSFDAKIASAKHSLEVKYGYVKNEAAQAHNNHRELKASLVREKLEAETKLEKFGNQFEQKMAAQQKAIDELLDSHKRLEDELNNVREERTTPPADSSHTGLDKINEDVDKIKEQVGRLESRQDIHQDLQQSQSRSLVADVSKIRLENARLRDDVETIRETAARRNELAAVKTDCSSIRAENSKLSTVVAEIRNYNRDLNTRFGEYAQMTSEHEITITRLDTMSQEHGAGISRLDSTMKTHEDEISRLDRVTREHQDELSRLDLTMLEQVAEAWGIEWPNILSSVEAFPGVKRRVEKLEKVYLDEDRVGRLTPVGSTADVSRQGSVASRTDKEDRLTQDLKSRVSTAEDKAQRAEEQVAGVETFTRTAMLNIGKVIDDINKRVKSIEARLALPVMASAPYQQEVSELRSTVDSVVDKFEALNGRFDELGSQVKQLETRVEELARQATPQSLLHSDPEVTKFKTKVEKFEDDFEKLSTEVQGVSQNFEWLNHQVTNLDSQYNNITTKPLAEHILAHMEQVYPTTGRSSRICKSYSGA